jgi:polysaccharide biosynthesis/export protein
MFMLRFIFCTFLLSVLLGACSINTNLMFKTDRDFAFDQIDVDSTNKEYRIAPNDILTVQMYSNEGSLIMEYTTSGVERQRVASDFQFVYPVNAFGYADLPIIGPQKLAGMTIIEAQDFLESLYKVQFNNPYCMVKAMNRRIMVFPGSGGAAAVIPLVNPNVSVIEALALAGGLADRGNASKVKLIRMVDGDQKVYLMNLATIEGIRYANMAVQAGDIVYVDPTPSIGVEIVKDLQPLLTLLTAAAIVFTLATR